MLPAGPEGSVRLDTSVIASSPASMMPPFTLRPGRFAIRAIAMPVTVDRLMVADNTRQDLPVFRAGLLAIHQGPF
jgi:hypothetical protein